MTSRPLVTVHPKDSVSEVLEKLKENNITSIIVVEPVTFKPLGFVDMLDILADVLLEVNIKAKIFTEEQIQFLHNQGQQFSKKECGALMNLSQRDPLVTMNLQDTLFSAVEKLSESHRIAIVNNDSKLVNFLSQMDILSFILSGSCELPNMKMNESDLTFMDFVGSLDEDTNIMAAMRYMRDCGVSGIAITNKEGRIITNFSSSDLLGLHCNNFSLLTLSVKEYLLCIYGFLKTPICCRVTDSVTSIMEKMDFFKVHRVYIVNENMCPFGFISITDFMKFFTSQS